MNESSNQQNKPLALFALCLGFFMVIIDVTIVNVALPTISVHLHATMSDLQWIVAGYSLTFASFLLTAGSLADRIGARTSYLWGLRTFILTSLGCGLSSSSIFLIGCRLLQGIAGALLLPTSLALINQLYSNKEKRDKAIGIWAAVGGIAAAFGPFLGGVLIKFFGWQAVFFVNVPVGIASIFLTTRTIPTSPSSQKNHLDIVGQLLAITFISALAFSLIESGKSGFHSIITLSGFAVFCFAFVGYLFQEKYCTTPMLPLTFFRSTQFSTANAVAMILNMGFYGQLFILPLYFQQMRMYTVFYTGLAILPLMSFLAISSYIAGKIVSKIGPRILMIAGVIFAGIGFLLMLVTESNGPHYIVLILPMAMIGFGSALTMPSATIVAISAVPHESAGIAAGTFNACRQIGGLMGVAIFGAIINASQNFMEGMHITLFVAAMIYFAASCLSMIFISKDNLHT